MKKILLILLLMMSTPTLGEWVKVEEVRVPNSMTWFEIFIDPTSVQRRGNLIRASVLGNYIIKDTDEDLEYRSSVQIFDINCNSQTGALASWKKFSRSMGRGSVVKSYDESPPNEFWTWKSMDDITAVLKAFNYICR